MLVVVVLMVLIGGRGRRQHRLARDRHTVQFAHVENRVGVAPDNAGAGLDRSDVRSQSIK